MAGIFLSPRRVSPFLAWGDFHARSRFARSAVSEENSGGLLVVYKKDEEWQGRPPGVRFKEVTFL